MGHIEKTREKNGMMITYRRYDDGKITCRITRSDDPSFVVVGEHPIGTMLLDEVKQRYGW